MKRTKLLFILLVTGFALVAAGCNHHKGGGHGKMFHHVLKKVTKELDLTKEQQTKLEEIKTEIIAKHKEKKATQGEKFDFLAQEIKKEQLDVAALEVKMEEHLSSRKEHRRFMLQKIAEFHAILTAEQRGKLADLITKHKDRFTKGHGKGHGRHW